MHTRSVALGICATVAGVMIGSAAIGYTQDLAGTAVPYRVLKAQPGNEYRIRHIQTTPLRRSSSSSSSSSSQESPAAVPSMTACDGATAALADMADVIWKTVPEKASNTAILETLATARFEIQGKYCSELPASSSSAATSSVRTLPTHPAPSVCDEMTFGTARYIQCVLDHAMGK